MVSRMGGLVLLTGASQPSQGGGVGAWVGSEATGVGVGTGVAAATGVAVVPDELLFPQPGRKATTATTPVSTAKSRILITYTAFPWFPAKGQS
jgi:hypothetical protein